MKLNLLIAFLSISNLVTSQTQSLEDRIHGLSTLILTSSPNITSQGTGFFYQKMGERQGRKDSAQWVKIENVYLVTNRHVIVLKDKDGKEFLPETFTFHLRKISEGSIIWLPISLNRDELKKRLRVFSDPGVDVAIIEIMDLINDALKKDKNIMAWSAVTEEDFAGKNRIKVEVTDEVIAIGYPRGFYDEFNVFPTVKSGTLASKWHAMFNKNPYFIIDIKLFPGSSGSVVISKPTNIVFDEGQTLYSQEKQFAFLGVYSGDPFKIDNLPVFESDDMVIYKVEKYGLGVVWYGEIIPNIIKNGIKFE